MLVAKVKNVLSGDQIVLVPSKATAIPPPERLLTLQDVRADSYAAKKYVHDTLIGKLVQFKVSSKAATREFGDVRTPLFDSLVKDLLEKGLAHVKDNVPDSDEVYELKQIQDLAKHQGKGTWSLLYLEPTEVLITPEMESKLKLSPLPCVVERAISGDRVMARIIVSDTEHIVTAVLLGGIKCPRTDEPAQQKIANLAKMFVEDKLMTTTSPITVLIIGESQLGVPIGNFNHPLGNNIAKALLDQGYAEVVDWQLTLVGSQIMSQYRKAELTAKALGKGMFAQQTAAGAKAPLHTGTKAKVAVGATIDATVAKVVSADTYVLRLADDLEITVQLASVRAPRPNDTTAGSSQAALVATAKEFARERTIGKPVQVYIDGNREANPEHGFDARFMVSIKVAGKDLLERLVSQGLATVLRHSKATAHERSLNWDRLVEIEEEAKTAKKGIHSTNIEKILTVGTRVVDASENATKAKTFFNGFKQKGRISGYYVDYVPLTNRVRLLNPKEGTKLALILGGLTNDKLGLLNDEGVKQLNKKLLQRNVEFDVYDADKVGGFIGNLYINQQATTPVQVNLVEEGLAKLHDIGVGANPFADKLEAAETAAKNAKRGVWANYDANAEQAKLEQAQRSLEEMLVAAKTPKFFDIEVVDINGQGVISFHMIDASTSAKFSQFKLDFNLFHQQHPSSLQSSVNLPFQLTKGPKKGELVSAKFENGKYYRARVQSFDRTTGKYLVKHIDFGNVDEVPLSLLRALPPQFNTAAYPAFAHSAVLSNVDLPPSKPTDYLTESIEALEDLCFDKKLVLGALPSTVAEYEGTLYDLANMSDLLNTINKQLVADGYGIVKKTCQDQDLIKAQAQAKRDHVGCWEFGDVTAADDDFA